MQVNDHWYHQDCYIRLRKEEGLSSQSKLATTNCWVTIIIIIILIWLISKLWPILTLP